MKFLVGLFLILLALAILGIAACIGVCKAHDAHQDKRRNNRR